MKGRAIVTANFGGYDEPKPIKGGLDAFYFTDSDIKVKGWTTINLGKQENPQRKSREVKILTHNFLPEYSNYMYMDANMSLFKLPTIDNLRVIHPTRECITQESKRVLELFGIDCEDQVQQYISEGMPFNFGLWANGFFQRDRTWDEIHEEWYKEYLGGTIRDQISFPYVLWKLGIDIETMARLITWDEAFYYINLYAHNGTR